MPFVGCTSENKTSQTHICVLHFVQGRQLKTLELQTRCHIFCHLLHMSTFVMLGQCAIGLEASLRSYGLEKSCGFCKVDEVGDAKWYGAVSHGGWVITGWRTYMHTCMHACMHKSTCVHTYIQTFIHTDMHTHTYTHTRTYIHT